MLRGSHVSGTRRWNSWRQRPRCCKSSAVRPASWSRCSNAMLANAARICEARFAILYLHDGNTFRAVAATHDAPPAYVESRKRDPAIRPAPDTPLGRVASTKQIAHIADLSKLQSYVERHPFVVAAVELGGFRTALEFRC